MNIVEEIFEKIKDSTNSGAINDFLLGLIDKPDIKNLKFLDHFINKSSSDFLEIIKINLVYVLGQIGSIEIIDAKYQEFLFEEYFRSDRWIRNEIIKAFNLISEKNHLIKKIVDILEYSILDDYLPIKISSISLLLKFEVLPRNIVINLLKIHNFSDSNVVDAYSKVMKKFYHDEKDVFDLLNLENLYKSLNKNTIRILLLIFFKSLLNLEVFRDFISNSDWDIKYKEIFLKEIYTFEKILMKRVY